MCDSLGVEGKTRCSDCQLESSNFYVHRFPVLKTQLILTFEGAVDRVLPSVPKWRNEKILALSIGPCRPDERIGSILSSPDRLKISDRRVVQIIASEFKLLGKTLK